MDGKICCMCGSKENKKITYKGVVNKKLVDIPGYTNIDNKHFICAKCVTVMALDYMFGSMVYNCKKIGMITNFEVTK